MFLASTPCVIAAQAREGRPGGAPRRLYQSPLSGAGQVLLADLYTAPSDTGGNVTITLCGGGGGGGQWGMGGAAVCFNVSFWNDGVTPFQVMALATGGAGSVSYAGGGGASAIMQGGALVAVAGGGGGGTGYTSASPSTGAPPSLLALTTERTHASLAALPHMPSMRR